MTSTKTIIEQLKSVRQAKGCTYQNIVDMTAEIGKPVSISTVRRVFSEDSDSYDFRYESTIQPIAAVLLGIHEKTEEPDEAKPQQSEEYYTSINALKGIILMKNEMIETLNDQVDSLNKLVARYHAEIKRRNRTERVLCIALIGLVAALLVLIVIDFSHTGIGWFRGRMS